MKNPTMDTLCVNTIRTLAMDAVWQANSGFGWERYTGIGGTRIGMETFGASAPLKELQHKFGFTPDQVVTAAKAQLAQARGATR